MKKTFVTSTMLAAAFACGAVFAQDASPSPAMDPAAQAQMEAWVKASTPNEKHKALEFEVGTWDSVSKFWMAEGQPPTESKGTTVNEWALGGRYVATKFTGEMQGQPFEGIGYLGHDNVEGQYVTTWMDTMSTGIYVYRGTMSEDGKVLTMQGEMKDPASGTMIKSRTVTTKVSDDQHTFEMFDTDASGKERKTMEITYTRKK